MSLNYILQICPREQISEILAFLLMRRECQCDRHSSIGIVINPCVMLVPLIHGIELSKRKWVNTNLIPPIPELGEDVRRQHLRVTSRHINISIFDFHEAKNHIDKIDFSLRIVNIRILDFRHKLDFID